MGTVYVYENGPFRWPFTKSNYTNKHSCGILVLILLARLRAHFVHAVTVITNKSVFRWRGIFHTGLILTVRFQLQTLLKIMLGWAEGEETVCRESLRCGMNGKGVSMHFLISFDLIWYLLYGISIKQCLIWLSGTGMKRLNWGLHPWPWNEARSSGFCVTPHWTDQILLLTLLGQM